MNFTIDSEAKFSGWLMKWLKILGHPQRVETTTGSGVPDINVCIQGYEMWIETKIGCSGKNDIILRKEQFAWGMKRAAAGGNALILAFCPVHDVIATYKFPYLKIKPYGKEGKYVQIVSTPAAMTAKKDFSIT